MHTAGVKRLPVVDEVGRLVGIVSLADLLKVLTRSDEAIWREVMGDVIVGDFMMDPSRFFIDVVDGVVVLQGRVERRSSSRSWFAPSIPGWAHEASSMGTLAYDADTRAGTDTTKKVI